MTKQITLLFIFALIIGLHSSFMGCTSSDSSRDEQGYYPPEIEALFETARQLREEADGDANVAAIARASGHDAQQVTFLEGIARASDQAATRAETVALNAAREHALSKRRRQ